MWGYNRGMTTERDISKQTEQILSIMPSLSEGEAHYVLGYMASAHPEATAKAVRAALAFYRKELVPSPPHTTPPAPAYLVEVIR